MSSRLTPREVESFDAKLENINGHFPDRIWIKTRTQGFNSYFYFLISDGKIYYKSVDPQREPQDWTLLEKTGLPHHPLKRGFIKPEKIIEFSADGNEMMAVSSEGIIYRLIIDLDKAFFPLAWLDSIGWPEPTPLRLNKLLENNRAWGLGKRGAEVLWYEDRFGNQHHFGTMGILHNYFLLEDGQEIRFSDTGLPSDFSHNFLGPERGRFIAEGLSASGCTIFLINEAGEMYTRLVDYDSVGSDPMFFKYTYKKMEQKEGRHTL